MITVQDSYLLSVRNVFGEVDPRQVGCIARFEHVDGVLETLLSCSRQLDRLGIKVRVHPLVFTPQVGSEPDVYPLIEVLLPYVDSEHPDGTWHVLVTESIEELRRGVISEVDLQRARQMPSVAYAGSVHLCSMMPSENLHVITDDAKSNKEAQRNGERNLVMHKVEVMGEERALPFVVLPYMSSLMRQQPELTWTDASVPEYKVRIPVMHEFIRMATLFSRGLRHFQSGEFLSERKILEIFQVRGQKGCAYWQIFPWSFKTRDGRQVNVTSGILNALCGNRGQLRRTSRPRVDDGAFIPVLATPMDHTDPQYLGPRECRIPRHFIHGAEIGDIVLFSKAPSFKSPVLTIVGWSDVGCQCHGSVLKEQNGDCDGDTVRIIKLPQGIDVGTLHPEQLFNLDESALTKCPKIGEVYDFSQDVIDDPCASIRDILPNKRLMGPMTVLRILAGLHQEFAAIEWATNGGLDIAETVIKKAAGKKANPKKGTPAVGGGKMTRAEVLNILDSAKGDPTGAADILISKGELFATHADWWKETCQYLATLPECFSWYIAHPPVQRVLTESRRYWTPADAIACFETYGTRPFEY